MNRESLRKLDEFFFSYDMRMARAWGWLTVVMLFAFILALKIPALSWADFPTGLGVFWGLFEVGRWTLRATVYREYYAQLESEETETDYADEGNPPVAYVPTPRIQETVDEETIRARANFYAFVYHVTTQGVTSETAWQAMGLGTGKYRAWIAILEELGIVSPTSQGKGRKVLMPLEQALETISQDVQRRTGIEDYWKPIQGYYNPASSNTTLLIMSN